MNVQIYLIIGLSLILSMFFLDKKSLKRFVRKDFWTQIDEISNNDLVQRLMIFSNESDNSYWKMKIRKSIKEVVGKSGIPMLTFIRFQTISIISSISAFVIQIFLFFGSIFNLIIHRKRLEILAENMGPKVLEMPSFNILFALAIGILFYFLPLLLFKIYGIFREKKAQKEIMLLQTYTLMMLSSGKSVKYILEILLNRSDIYKSSFRKCLQEYSYNPVNAFEILKNDISLPGFTSTVNALEKSLLYDRNMAEEYLRNSRILESNLRKINLQKSNKNKQMTGTVLLILPLIAFCVVCGYPWFVMVLKLMSNLNGL